MTEPVRPLEALKRYDLVQINACYTTDHEMEPSDDGEWVRFDDADAIIDRLLLEIQHRFALLQAAAPPAPTAEQKELIRHLCHFDWCAQNQDAYPWAWRDGDAEKCDCGLASIVANVSQKWMKP